MPEASGPTPATKGGPASVTRAVRIAHFALGRTNPEAADGMDKTVYHLSRTQATLGHAVRLFSITNKQAIPIPGVQVSTYPSLVAPAILPTHRLRDLLVWRSPFNLPARLMADLVAWGPDVLHLHGVHIPQHFRLAQCALRHQIPYCVTVHGMLAPGAESRRPMLKRMVAAFQRPFLNRALFVHALTEREAQDIRGYGIRTPIVVASNGIDPAFLSPAASTQALDGGVDFLFLGRLDPDQKGLDALLEGFASSGLTEASLHLAGPDWRGGQRTLEAIAQRLGVSGRVRFVGRVMGTEKLNLLARSTVFVHPSRWEGVAFSVLEAAAMSKPILLTQAADPRGEFQRAGAAVIVAPEASAIAQGLRTFVEMSAAARFDLGQRARMVVQAEFSWPATAQTLLHAYLHDQSATHP